MAHIVKQNRPIEKKLIPKAEALDAVREEGPDAEVPSSSGRRPGEQVQCYTMGEFIDFCLGPHLPSTRQIKAFKLKPEPVAVVLEGHAKATRRCSASTGTRFFTQEELEQHLHRLEEAKRRDHRKLGRELDLFSIADETGAGLILWHPKGGFIRKQIEDYWRDEHLDGRLRPRLQRRTSRSSTSGTRAGTPSTTRPTCTRRSRSRASSTS